MLYIHHTACISSRFSDDVSDGLKPGGMTTGNRMIVKEPSYPGIPANVLRRMGKAGRMGAGVCLPLLQEGSTPVSGIILGTGNGGTEDSFRFLEQMVAYGEEALSPGTFVQSTANGLAAQLSLMMGERGYNTTHVHGGLAFEQALQDAMMISVEDADAAWLVAGVDELSRSNFVLDTLQGWYKPEDAAGDWDALTPGTIAGEGAAAFVVSRRPGHATAAVITLATLHTDNAGSVAERMRELLTQSQPIDLLITGENADSRLETFYSRCEQELPVDVPVLLYKPGCGEYPTSTAIALWLACRILSGAPIPPTLLKRGTPNTPATILIYNNYKGYQHSFLLVSAIR